MKTRLLTADDIAEAADIIRAGGLVVFPTETVYGIGAAADNSTACNRIFAVKGRPRYNPLIVHCADITQAERSVVSLSPRARLLLQRHSPGPLTLVAERSAAISPAATAGKATVAIRIPDHPLALALATYAGCPIAAPSANPSGRVSPTTYAMVREYMDGLVDAIIDGGDCRLGLESTIIALRDDRLAILRHGMIPADAMLASLAVAGLPTTIATDGNGSSDQLVTPGRIYAHYRPHAELMIVEPEHASDVCLRFARAGKRVGIICYSTSRMRTDTVHAMPTLHAGSHHALYSAAAIATVDNTSDYARLLYRHLHGLDHNGCNIIMAEPPPPDGIGATILDRLHHAAGY